MNLGDIRTDYRKGRLCRADLAENPITQFKKWLEEAIHSKEPEPTAMILATVSADGQPLQRNVLLKGIDDRGFVFYTNLESRKARHLRENPRVSLLFSWYLMERQVIIRGTVSPVTEDEAEQYFASRPRESQLAAWASRQSSPIPNRETLEARLAEVKARFGNGQVPLPPFWGGFRVVPSTIEFWQGGAHRLHDRFEYTATPEGWKIERLCP